MYPAAHDAVVEMQPVSMISATPLMIIGKNGLPPKDAKELIAWLKANPGKASAATVGAGSAAAPAARCKNFRRGSFMAFPF